MSDPVSSSIEIIDFPALISAAWEVRSRAYAPYSQFAVGAALLGANGVVYQGCNVENLSYGLTICAERGAICQAIAAGCRTFTALAVVADTQEPISPCGACRQVLAEFGEFPVIMATKEKTAETTISALLPRAKTGILDHA